MQFRTSIVAHHKHGLWDLYCFIYNIYIYRSNVLIYWWGYDSLYQWLRARLWRFSCITAGVTVVMCWHIEAETNGRHFVDDIFKRIFFNENVWSSIKISLKFVPKGPINKILALFQIMAWRRPGDKPLSEAMLVSLLTHICVIRPQWVKSLNGTVQLIEFPILYEHRIWDL